MPEPTMDLTIYENMETEQLEQLLREDANTTRQVLDPQTLICITGLLSRRKQTPSPKRAWEDFQRYYLKDCTSPSVKGEGRYRSLWQQLSAVAAILVLLLCIPAVSNADECGYAQDHRAVWNRDGIWFEWKRSTLPDPASNYLKDCSVEQLQQKGWYPSWIPEGFALTETVYADREGVEDLSFCFYDGDRLLVIDICEAKLNGSYSWSVNGDSVQAYRCLGRTYYVFRNVDRYGACWIQDGMECCFSGDISIREVEEMIRSIK